MLTIVLSLALTGAETAPANHPYGYGYGYGNCYGRYGTYGSFCDGYADWDPCGTTRCPQILPFAFYPCIDCGSKDKAAMEKKVEDMKYVLGKFEQKIVGLEEKFSVLDRKYSEGFDNLSKKQAESFQQLDRKLSDQLQALDRRHTDMMKNLEDKLLTADRFRALESKIDEKFNQGMSKLEERLRNLELRIGKQRKSPEGPEASNLEQKIEGIERVLREIAKNGFRGGDTKITAVVNDQTRRDMLKRALIIVQTPADAKLYLDNLLTAGGTNLRTFYTPELESGVNYYYTLRVELPRDGRILTETQRVYFQAGREVRVSFEHLSPDPSQRIEKQ
jgi:uncharacterized protein (TIGR03000 family)